MDLDDDECKFTQAMRKERIIKGIKAEIEEGNYCITLYGSDKQVIGEIISDNEKMKSNLDYLDEKIKKLENIIDYDRYYEWEKEIYCVEILKQTSQVLALFLASKIALANFSTSV